MLIFARLMMGGIVPGIGSPAQTKEIRDFLSSIQVGRPQRAGTSYSPVSVYPRVSCLTTQVAENTTALTFVFQTWAKVLQAHLRFFGDEGIARSLEVFPPSATR